MGARVIVFGMNGNARPAVHQVEIVEKGLVDLRLVHLELHVPGRDPARRERPARPGPDDHAPRSGSTTPSTGIARLRSGEAVKIVIRP